MACAARMNTTIPAGSAPDNLQLFFNARRGLRVPGLLLLTSFCFVSASVFALPDYEPFASATGSGGTSYSTGANLIGQTNAALQTWWQAGPGGNPQPTVAAGDLTVSGLYSAGGGQSAAFGGNGTSARLNLSVPAGGITAGTVYFSFAMKLTDLSGLTTGGQYWAGFNNVQGSQTTTPGTVVTRVTTRSATGGFNIGLQEGSQTTLGNLVWNSSLFTTSDTIFLVGSYTFNPSTGDDVSQLWVNPNSSTFGAGSAPGGSLTSSGGTDIARVASFVLYDRSVNEPAGGLIDDLRFGLNWADVTPVVPEPSTCALGILGLAALCVRRFARR